MTEEELKARYGQLGTAVSLFLSFRKLFEDTQINKEITARENLIKNLTILQRVPKKENISKLAEQWHTERAKQHARAHSAEYYENFVNGLKEIVALYNDPHYSSQIENCLNDAIHLLNEEIEVLASTSQHSLSFR